MRGCVDAGYCADLETSGVFWRVVQLVWPPGEVGVGDVGFSWVCRHLTVLSHTTCLGLIVPYVQIRKLRPGGG